MEQSTDQRPINAILVGPVEICRAEFEGKGIRTAIQCRAGRHWVNADPASLQQVFWNLIKNAVKFAPTAGRLILTTETDEAGRFRLSVSDTGIGITRETLPRIFTATQPPLRRRSRNEGIMRILIVDDHEDTSMVMRRLLSRLGYEVTTANTVGGALAEAEKADFDLLISDIGLPDGTGLQLMEEIRKRRPIRGIALSGFGMDEDVKKSKAAGFSEHLTKPVNFQTLEALIREVSMK